MMDVGTAGGLLDFAQRIGPGQRAEEQLQGAVAIHNILRRHKVAYLADEVGMGKTYVALGALALFRHFDPGFRVLVIAPRRNIQLKWVKEMGNFTRNNVRFADLRVKGIDGEPARARVVCENLVGLVRETALNPERDFFVRLTSFSLPVGGEDAGRSAEAKRLRDELRAEFPWLAPGVFDLRDRRGFKDSVARAICCVLPVFDLVIVDEAHNLKHGFGAHVSSRNRVLSIAFGHPDGAGDARYFPNYGLRARRVLFLSATPVEESYRQLWNQLDVFGRGKPFTGLQEDHLDEERKKALAREFLIRRVTEIRVNGRSLTKNLYRREWRAGGVAEHDQPIRVQDNRERLVVALVQKKVSELLGSARFGNAFQIGMLASFESFLETARVKPAGAGPEAAEAEGNFDDTDQTQDQQEREGIDVASLNRLARCHRRQFGRELPHPKMDALVRRLAAAWATGEKSLVFVRRVASVKELKRKLDEHYNGQLIGWMRGELAKVLPLVELERFDRLVKDFHKERREVLDQGVDELGGATGADETDDRGGTDTFFAWFLRGESAHKDGSVRLLDGPLVRKRHSMPQSPFFEDNYAAHVLQCPPGEVLARLAAAAGLDPAAVRAGLRERARPFLRARKKLPRGDRFVAAQAAVVQWLVELEGPHRERARAVWRERFVHCHVANPIAQAPDLADLLECRTFFTELRGRPDLRRRLWPEPGTADPAEAFREQELRARLLSAAARLGHAFIDLYLLTLCRLRTLGAGAGDEADEASGDSASHGIAAFLDLLETQMNTPLAGRRWGAYDELAQLAARDEAGHSNFDLILDTNDPDLRTAPLEEAGRRFGTLLSRQQPAAGMAGKLNQTLVRQFRMPGYPLVLVSTDLLQEGEDLHTFCSSIHHYGISWTPSAMEQRIGRIDRVRSQTERRLAALRRELRDEEKLQVYFPHLQDTVEVVQVQRVLARMNTFLRLMHEGLTLPGGEERKLDLNRELLGVRRVVPQILTPLQTAFGVQPRHLEGGGKTLTVSGEAAAVVQRRFNALPDARFPGLRIDWERSSNPARLLGTVHLGKRVQPFTLLLHSLSGAIVVRCVSPVGQRRQFEDDARLRAATAQRSVSLGAIPTEEKRTYDLTVENDVLFPVDDEAACVARVAWLIRRVTREADRLEQDQLPGQDQPLAMFRGDLEKERPHEG